MKITRSIAAMLAFASATPVLADEVNVYSYRQPELIQPLLDAFTRDTGINVNVAFLNKGMIERLLAEGKRSPADIILTTDISRLAKAVEAGVTQPVHSDILHARIPAAFRDPDDQWFGLTTRARIVYASRDRVGPGEVTTYEDLADEKWRGRICTRSGSHAYMVALTSAVIYHLGEGGAKTWLEGVKANLARKPQGNDRAQVKAIWAGECDISLGNTYYMGAMLADPDQVAWANSIRLEFPTFENGGTHVNVSGAAMTKAAPNHDSALKFLEFLASDEAQEIYSSVVYEYPVASDVPISPAVAAWGSFTPDDVNLMDLAALRADALRITQEVDFDG